MNLYNIEIENRIKLSDQINIPILILTAIGTLSYFIIFNYSYDRMISGLTLGAYIFWTSSFFIIPPLVWSIYYLIKFYLEDRNAGTHSLPNSEELEDYYNEMYELFGDANNAEIALQEEIIRLLTTGIIDNNRSINQIKRSQLVQAKWGIVCGIIIVSLNGFMVIMDILFNS